MLVISGNTGVADQHGIASLDSRILCTAQVIENIVSSRVEEFTATVQEAGQLARDESFDHLRLIGEYYSQLRRFEPAFLSTFEFQGGRVVESLLATVD